MKMYLIGSDRKQRPHARRAFCHRLRAAMALLNVTGIGLSPRWNLQNGTCPAYKKNAKEQTNNHNSICFDMWLFISADNSAVKKKITNSIKLFYNTKTVLSWEVLRKGLQTFHKASNSVCVQKPALIFNEGNLELFGSRSVFEVLQYNHW